MTRLRLPLLLLSSLVVCTACAYESSGTTTTTSLAEDAVPPATSPASIVFEDQRIEGSAVLVESLTLPATGFVVLQDAAGELIGLSEVIGPGRIDDVPVPFFVPIDADTTVSAALHIDMDRDRTFIYEPPDSFIDVPAVTTEGAAAAATASVVLLPRVAGGDLAVAEQRISGSPLEVQGVTLPAPGFVAVQVNEGGAPGRVIGATGLLPAGTTEGEQLMVELDPPLRVTGRVFVVAYVDRDENGVLDPEDGDEPAQTEDGEPVQADPVITVVPLDPSSVETEDQEGDGTAIAVASVTLASGGFVDIRIDDGGIPGERIARSEWLADGTYEDLVFTPNRPLDADTRIWVRVVIDFDENQRLGDAEPLGVTEDGRPAIASLEYTFVEPDDDGDGS
jgi:hypothetical protein